MMNETYVRNLAKTYGLDADAFWAWAQANARTAAVSGMPVTEFLLVAANKFKAQGTVPSATSTTEPTATAAQPRITRQTTIVPPGGSGSSFGNLPTGMRPINDVPMGGATPTEAEAYYPFTDERHGGSGQAAYNIMTQLGFNPRSGNPAVDLIQGHIAPMWNQYYLDKRLEGQMPDPAVDENAPNAAAGAIMEALRNGGGSTNLLNPRALLERLRTLATGQNVPETEDVQGWKQGFQSQLRSESGALSILRSLLGDNASASPFLRSQIAPMLQDRLQQFRQAAVSDPGLNAFSFLSRGF